MARISSKPDPHLCMDQLDALCAMRAAWGDAVFASAMFWIMCKEEKTFSNARSSRLIPFQLNRAQRHLLPRLSKHNRIEKGRQMGFSTFCLLMRLLLPISTAPGKTGMLVAQNDKYVGLMFQMVHRAALLYGAKDPSNPDVNDLQLSLKQNLLHTKFSNRHEIHFDWLDSRLIIESGENEEAGQSVTLHHLVASEYSRWPGDPEATMSNLLGALVKPEGTVDEECTCNGAAGPFYEGCLRSMNDPEHADAKHHFYEWFWDEGYQTPLEQGEAEEMEKDLKSDELAVIALMHKRLKEVTF